MAACVVIGCIDTRNPPDALDALPGDRFVVHRIRGLERAHPVLRDADAVITELNPITGAMIAEDMPRCRAIVCASTGFDYVDLRAAAARRIPVSNVPGYCTDEVATHTIALVLSRARRLPELRRLARAGEWDPRSVRPLPHVRGQTLGVIGYGRIGRAVARKAQALGLRVVACDPYVDPAEMTDAGVHPVDRPTLLREADWVSLHVPLTAETRGMIDAAALAAMKRGAYLLNTARGALVDETALLDAVRSGRLAGAAVDVLASEPPPADHPFFGEDRILVTPHVAWCSEEADRDVWQLAAAEVARVLGGDPPRWAVDATNGDYKQPRGAQ
jgi:D-3-phosphoglycerate dehydrogenase